MPDHAGSEGNEAADLLAGETSEESQDRVAMDLANARAAAARHVRGLSRSRAAVPPAPGAHPRPRRADALGVSHGLSSTDGHVITHQGYSIQARKSSRRETSAEKSSTPATGKVGAVPPSDWTATYCIMASGVTTSTAQRAVPRLRRSRGHPGARATGLSVPVWPSTPCTGENYRITERRQTR